MMEDMTESITVPKLAATLAFFKEYGGIGNFPDSFLDGMNTEIKKSANGTGSFIRKE